MLPIKLDAREWIEKARRRRPDTHLVSLKVEVGLGMVDLEGERPDTEADEHGQYRSGGREVLHATDGRLSAAHFPYPAW